MWVLTAATYYSQRRDRVAEAMTNTNAGGDASSVGCAADCQGDLLDQSIISRGGWLA